MYLNVKTCSKETSIICDRRGKGGEITLDAFRPPTGNGSVGICLFSRQTPAFLAMPHADIVCCVELLQCFVISAAFTE